MYDPYKDTDKEDGDTALEPPPLPPDADLPVSIPWDFLVVNDSLVPLPAEPFPFFDWEEGN